MCWFSQHDSSFFGNDRYDPKQPHWNFDGDNPALSQSGRYISAKLGRSVCFSFREEVPPPNDSPVYGFEDSLYQIFHVNEGDELRFEPDDEIESVFDTFHHQVVISLIGAVYSGGTHDHVGESFQQF